MDQDTLVIELKDGGKQLVEELIANDFPISVAFWAKPTEEGKWYLYLASPKVNAEGPAISYRFVHRTMRQMPNNWVDPAVEAQFSPLQR